jgi:hypothetical protein
MITIPVPVTSTLDVHSNRMISFAPSQTNPPAWLRWFVNDAVQGILDRQAAAPIGCHFYHESTSDTWEVALFLSRTEVCGGPADGKRVPSGLQVDIVSVAAAFDAAPAVHWQAEKINDDDELGNHLSFEGMARGHSVWLRILQIAPDWIEPGRLIHSRCGRIEDVW